MISKEYDFIIDQYDNIDQSEIYKIVNNKRVDLKENWIDRFRKDTFQTTNSIFPSITI